MMQQSNEYFVKGALVFSIMVMVLLPSMIVLFVPSPDSSNATYQSELENLMTEYENFTGTANRSEQIWALTGIYTPYGIDANGDNSTAYMTLLDGWVAGDRIVSYRPSQYYGNDAIDNGKLSYTVNYDADKRLYYYTNHGADLLDITNGTVGDPSSGTLYTSVSMDVQQQSNQFMTVGNKQELDNGTFYYKFTGYRYCFQSLSNYYYDSATPVDATTSSLSLIWYRYLNDSGINGQMVLSGSDSGLAYITAQQIVSSFNSANFTSKFEMVFNGITMNIYIQLNPYAISHNYTVEDCYNNGYFSVLVTSMAESTSGTNGGFNGLGDADDPTRMWKVVKGLMTFDGKSYGLDGYAGTIASTIFSVSMYSSLIAIGVGGFWPILIIAGILAMIQTAFSTGWLDGLFS